MAIAVKLKGDDQLRLVFGDTVKKDESTNKLIIQDLTGKVVGEFRLDNVEEWYTPAKD